MKLLRASILAAAVTLAAGAASAQSMSAPKDPVGQPHGWYVGVGAGYTSVEPDFLTINNAQARAKFKDGFAVLGSGGYKWDDNFRTELEVSYRENKAKDFNGRTLPWTGTMRDTSAMANVLFDLQTGTNWVPYVGVGGGIVWLNWDQLKGPGPTVYDGTSSKVAWQGIAGVAVSVTPQAQITLDFRYKGSNGHSYPGSAAGSLISGYDYRARTVMLGFRYAFNKPAPVKTAAAPPPPPPPAAPPPPPARPAAPPVEQKFLVFFDFDKSNLRADAQKIVSEAADYAKKNGKAKITATGHTDTSGTAAYNLALSERRAKAVQKELVRLGIPEKEIVVRWKGESEPLVQTGDGVKEPQNRRVEIVLE